MKKILSVFLLLLCMVSFASCKGDTPKPDPTPEEIETYTVTFNTMGGSSIADATTDTNGKVAKPANPTKDYFVFADWYTTEACTGDAWNFDTAFTANTTLYAKWNELGVMSYAQFMAAENGDFVRIQGYISAKQSWYAGKATMYLTDAKGEGYFAYEIPMTQEEYNTKYTVGTCIELKATKTIYSGEHEIMGSNLNSIKVVEDAYAMDQIAIDVSNDVSVAATSKVQNAYFTAVLKVKEYATTDPNATVAPNKAYGFKGDAATDDLYFTLVDKAGNELSCCVEYYLTGTATSVYQMVLSTDFVVDAYVKVTGYMYFYDDKPNPHITSITLTDDDLTYETFRAASDGDAVTAKGLLIAKTSYYNGSTNLYVADADSNGNSEGYYVYGYKCTQEQYNELTCFYSQIYSSDATYKYLTITGKKASYAGMEEIVDATVTATDATEEYMTQVSRAAGATSSITSTGSTLDVVQSCIFSGTYIVREYTTTDQNTTVADSKAYGYKGDAPTDDIYLRLEDEDGNIIDFCMEAYIVYPVDENGESQRTIMLNFISELMVGAEIEADGFLYWWYGPNPHLLSIYTQA